jgi:hypothetical protein
MRPKAFTLTVDQSPAFTSPAAATVSTGSPATVDVTTSGYPGATIALSGTLPTGMTFTADPAAGTAAISGRPAASGVYALTLTATNGVGSAATQTLTLIVEEPPGFTSPAATTFHATEHGSFEITTAASPVATVSLSGSLPPAVTFAADPTNGTAVLSGTPPASAAGTYRLTLTATNGLAPDAAQAFVLTVAPAAPSNTFTISHVKTGKTTQIAFDVKVPGPGTVTAAVTAPGDAKLATAAKQAKRKRVTVAKAEAKVKHGETIKLKTKPNSAGRRFAGSAQSKDQLWLTVTYKPTGGTARSDTIKHLHLK